MAARTLQVAWETWRTGRGGPPGVARRQRERLADLVRHARRSSPYYRRLYRELPVQIAEPHRLPVTHKRDLMTHFDEWTTDFAVTLADLRKNFLSDLSRVGDTYLGRYHVFTTSGTTGEPAVIVHDADSWAVMNLVPRLRGRQSAITRRELPRGLRSAALFATVHRSTPEVQARCHAGSGR